MTADDNRPQWPTGKLTALRLGGASYPALS